MGRRKVRRLLTAFAWLSRLDSIFCIALHGFSAHGQARSSVSAFTRDIFTIEFGLQILTLHVQRSCMPPVTNPSTVHCSGTISITCSIMHARCSTLIGKFISAQQCLQGGDVWSIDFSVIGDLAMCIQGRDRSTRSVHRGWSERVYERPTNTCQIQIGGRLLEMMVKDMSSTHSRTRQSRLQPRSQTHGEI